ncbi:related to tRNA (guanine(26)-N(2))-dimethyltransferase, mitochondrial [Saccharomycodes ludwigii]|uniref:tRNA (guanine(26)-N(2))-dimethyltransferase n=1 Tax=Saccharomycodes ludwigii TaxID=36035 RepID=A0A376B4D1_9ASCO|nr:hypothetical protein SCDLUD_001710 [Saccharomycodes ludwigii]KAH3901926.1 hypothetical protein SCDLUD_001710 [Saccharomycodes ludwigii]SSD59548.1 related to tRNA (guanine(26)-N(2))-dimethyltransferase, mitochondrial [Saccharomycodes ludwigii]
MPSNDIAPAINETQPSFNLDDYKIIVEGSTSILTPKSEADVFYNPVQQFNRDLSVTCIKAWANLYLNPKQEGKEDIEEPELKKIKIEEKEYIKKFTILEALSATGLRAIRYSKEIPNISKIVANDLLPAAVDTIKRNIEYNKASTNVIPNLANCNAVMYTKEFDCIDLDPYGTVAPFIDAAIQSIKNGGLLLVTCTDLQVLAGQTYPEKCFALYGGSNLMGHDATHESALRLVLGLIKTTAAKYGKYVEPLLSLSIDFYVRVFVRVHNKPIKVKDNMSEQMIGYMCHDCDSIVNQYLGKREERTSKKGKPYIKYGLSKAPTSSTECKVCKSGVQHLVGPMYGGAIHNKDFIKEVLRINKEEHEDNIYKTRKRIEGMLTLAYNELPDTPFYFSPSKLSSILKISVPSLKYIVAGLGSLGYECSLSHAQPSVLKTNADWNTIWYVMKEYVRMKEPNYKVEKLNENATGYRIMTNEDIKLNDSTKSISFEPNDMSYKIEKLRKLKMVRYQENPTRNWGPKAKPN